MSSHKDHYKIDPGKATKLVKCLCAIFGYSSAEDICPFCLIESLARLSERDEIGQKARLIIKRFNALENEEAEFLKLMSEKGMNEIVAKENVVQKKGAIDSLELDEEANDQKLDLQHEFILHSKKTSNSSSVYDRNDHDNLPF